jgi:hypothetical protein
MIVVNKKGIRITIEGFENEPIVIEEIDKFAFYATTVNGSFKVAQRGNLEFMALVDAKSRFLLEKELEKNENFDKEF